MTIQDFPLKVIPFSATHAFGPFRLPQRTDMFDRMLVATALVLDATIISGDREFSHYDGVKIIWRGAHFPGIAVL